MMELKYALENNVSVEVNTLNENEVIAVWNNGMNVEVITTEQAKELGLVNEETKTELEVVKTNEGYEFKIEGVTIKRNTKNEFKYAIINKTTYNGATSWVDSKLSNSLESITKAFNRGNSGVIKSILVNIETNEIINSK